MSVYNFKKVIVVTGGNRGIGSGILELFCQQNDVQDKILVVASRNQDKSLEKINELRELYPAAGESLHYMNLDLSCDKSIKNFSNKLKNTFKHVNVLYNNAAIMHKHKKPILDRAEREKDINETFQTNFWGMVNLTESLIPVIKEGGHIVGMSTALAKFKLSKRLNEKFLDENLSVYDLKSLYEEYMPLFIENKIAGSEWDDKQPLYGCYNISKLFLNSYTILLKNRFKRENKNIRANCVTPGWCKTDMGGEEAPRTHLKGAETCVWLESLPTDRDDSLSGNLYYDKKKISWV